MAFFRTDRGATLCKVSFGTEVVARRTAIAKAPAVLRDLFAVNGAHFLSARPNGASPKGNRIG